MDYLGCVPCTRFMCLVCVCVLGRVPWAAALEEGPTFVTQMAADGCLPLDKRYRMSALDGSSGCVSRMGALGELDGRLG